MPRSDSGSARSFAQLREFWRMKRWTWRPEEAVGGRKRNLEAFLYANLRGKTRAAVEQSIMLRCVVAQVRHLLVLSVAVAT